MSKTGKYENYQLKITELNSNIFKINKEIFEINNNNNNILEFDIEKKVNELSAEKEILIKEKDILQLQILNYIEFDIDENLKLEYLKQKPIDTAKSDYPTIKAVDEYEILLGKPIYDFSLAERDELMMMKFKNTTLYAVNSTVSKIKGYIDFCVRAGAVVHNQNIFDTLTKAEAKKFVSKQATEFRYISKEKLKEYQDILVNSQDKLLLELPYIGVRGRTVKGGTLEEIINLQVDPNSNDVKNCKLELFRNDGTSRIMTVTQKTMDLIIETYNDYAYLSNNGMESPNLRGGARDYPINRFENYVLCSLGKSKFDKLNPIVINARMQKIQEYCDNQYITINNLYMSGMITMAKDVYEVNGELTKKDYIDICKRFKYGDKNPEKYYSKIKAEVELYLKGGIQDA